MKKITLLSVLLVSVLAVSAQDAKKYHIGVKISPNISWLKPDNKHITNEGNKIRYGFGLVADIHFTDNYAIGTGLNIFQTGGQLSYLRMTNEEGFDQVSHINRSYRLQYGEIPLTLKMRTNEIGYITYWGQFGLGLGVNIRAHADDEIDYIYSRSNAEPGTENFPWETSPLASRSLEDEDIKDDITLFRTSLILGAGIEYNIAGSTSLLVGITYNNGFSDALRGEGLQVDDRDEVIFEGTGQDRVPVKTKLKGMSNFIELTVGVMF